MEVDWEVIGEWLARATLLLFALAFAVLLVAPQFGISMLNYVESLPKEPVRPPFG